MEILDVDSLFTKMLLEETMDICANTLFENTIRVEGLSKVQFRNFYILRQKIPVLILMKALQTSQWSSHGFAFKSSTG